MREGQSEGDEEKKGREWIEGLYQAECSRRYLI